MIFLSIYLSIRRWSWGLWWSRVIQDPGRASPRELGSCCWNEQGRQSCQLYHWSNVCRMSGVVTVIWHPLDCFSYRYPIFYLLSIHLSTTFDAPVIVSLILLLFIISVCLYSHLFILIYLLITYTQLFIYHLTHYRRNY